jgi:hypothetical protein
LAILRNNFMPHSNPHAHTMISARWSHATPKHRRPWICFLKPLVTKSRLTEFHSATSVDTCNQSGHLTPPILILATFFLCGFLEENLLVRNPGTLMELTALFIQLYRTMYEDVMHDHRKRVRSQRWGLAAAWWLHGTQSALGTFYVLLCYSGHVILNMFLQNTEANWNLNGPTYRAPPCKKCLLRYSPSFEASGIVQDALHFVPCIHHQHSPPFLLTHVYGICDDTNAIRSLMNGKTKFLKKRADRNQF